MAPLITLDQPETTIALKPSPPGISNSPPEGGDRKKERLLNVIGKPTSVGGVKKTRSAKKQLKKSSRRRAGTIRTIKGRTHGENTERKSS